MPISQIYDAYGEDGDIAYMNGSVGSGVLIADSGDFYRTSYARCAIGFQQPAFGIRLWQTGAQTSAWCSYRISAYGNTEFTNTYLWGLLDASNVLRLALVASQYSIEGPFEIVKLDVSGTATSLGMTTSGFSSGPNSPDKFDVFYNYVADPTEPNLLMYINGSLVFSYTGDITTNSQTELAGTYHAQAGKNNVGQSYYTYWSECVVASGDTRDVNLFTSYATGEGSLDQWTGTYTNVSEIVVNDENFDTTSTSGAVQRYEMLPLSAGNYSIVGVVTNLRATQGGGELTHIALQQKIGSGTYTASAVDFPTSYGAVQFIQMESPATSAAWAQTELATGFESGYEATT
jgi:hypothetical protein